MDFEKLMARNKGLASATASEASATLSGYPVIANTSGLRAGEVVNAIKGHKVVVPTIQGTKQSATVVLFAEIIDSKGALVPRLLFLSTLIRKINLDDDYSGMIATDANFAKRGDFSNQEWVKAFTAAAPFRIDDIKTEEREIQRANDPAPVTIKVKELSLSKMTKVDAKKLITSEAPAEAGADTEE